MLPRFSGTVSASDTVMPKCGLEELDELQDAGRVDDALLDESVVVVRHPRGVTEQVVREDELGEVGPDLRFHLLFFQCALLSVCAEMGSLGSWGAGEPHGADS